MDSVIRNPKTTAGITKVRYTSCPFFSKACWLDPTMSTSNYGIKAKSNSQPRPGTNNCQVESTSDSDG